MSGTSTRKKNITKAASLVAIICAVFFFNYRSVFDKKLDVNGDNINYFLLAKALSEGQGYVDIIPPVPVPHVHFPPGYPLFMAVFMHIFPDNIIAMKILNGILFLLAVLLLFRIVRKTTGNNMWLAFAVCLATVIHPTILRWSVIMMSEMLYIVISFGIILLCLDLDRHRTLRLILLCLLVMSAYLVRTMGISVVLAACLAFFVTAMKNQKEKRWMKPAVAIVAAVLSLGIAHAGWTIRNNHVAPGRGNDYSSGFMYTDTHERMTPSLWKDRIVSNVGEYLSACIPGAMLDPNSIIDHMKHNKPTVKGVLIGLLLVALMAFGVFKLKKGRVLIGSYIVITFAVLMLYQEQYAGIRYFIPVLPLMFLAALNGIFEIVKALTKSKLQKASLPLASAAAIVAALLLLPKYSEGIKLYRHVASFDSYEEMNPKSSFTHYIKAAEWLRDNIKGRPVIACRKPEIMFMYSGYKHAVRIPIKGTEEEVIQSLVDSKANCVVLDTWAKHAYSVVYPAMLKHPKAFPIYYQGPQDDEYAPTVVAAFLTSKLNEE